MGTQTIVIGQTCTTKKLVPIKFNQLLTETLEIIAAEHFPTDFKFIELICKNYCSTPKGCSLDLMFGYDDPLNRGCGTLLVGEWNDGVVE